MKHIRNIACGIALLATSVIHGAEYETGYTSQAEVALAILHNIAQHNNYYAAFLQIISSAPLFLVEQEVILMAYLAIMQLELAGQELSDDLQELYELLVYGHANCP